jgi:UDP-N-acetylglucosamine--N-acetylmuramyl-(pentapeptide) pyrophosphoryl-undecaprenol N-acetylglucosamine transferase
VDPAIRNREQGTGNREQATFQIIGCAVKIVIAGGGTGGHLFPGIAVAEELRARGHEVVFVGTARGIEAKAVPAAGWALELIDVKGIKGGGIGGALAGLVRVPKALSQSGTILKRVGAELVVGVGGYASGPVVMRAAVMGLPTAILEQNSVPGITNRILGRVVKRVFGAFAGAARYFPSAKYRLVGNPVRMKVRAALASAQPSAGRPGLLIVGGSQGAHAVNELVCGALLLLHGRGVRLPVVHQTGTADRDGIAARYAAAGLEVTVTAFIDDMAAAYRGAKLVVARAGASTLAELTSLGVPSFLIPFPHAADDHQTANARDLEAAGAARLFVQAQTTPEALAEALERTLADAAELRAMAEAARGLGRAQAHAEIVEELLSLAG